MAKRAPAVHLYKFHECCILRHEGETLPFAQMRLKACVPIAAPAFPTAADIPQHVPLQTNENVVKDFTEKIEMYRKGI